jgi:hypothetical protein
MLNVPKVGHGFSPGARVLVNLMGEPTVRNIAQPPTVLSRRKLPFPGDSIEEWGLGKEKLLLKSPAFAKATAGRPPPSPSKGRGGKTLAVSSGCTTMATVWNMLFSGEHPWLVGHSDG